MTFADIAAQCRDFPQRSNGTLRLGSELLPRLMAPHRRGWFRACHAWLHEGPAPDADEYKAEIRALLKTLDGFQRRMALVHLRCVKLIRDHWTSFQIPPEDALAALARKYKLQEFGFTEGFLRDLAQEFLTPPAQLQAATSPSTICGALNPAVRDQSLTALLVEDGQQGKPDSGGVVTKLTLELIDKGHGDLYPIPALAFVERRTDFLGAEQAALAWARTKGPWQHTWDARWRLERRDGLPLLPILVGPSLGGAFALGLAKLAVDA